MQARIPICIFAKPPVPGQVKTRLAPPQQAAALARAFLVDTYATVATLTWALPIVATTGELDAELREDVGNAIWLQGDGDLGARLERILRRALDSAPAAIAIGADAPGLPRDIYERAHAALASADAVIGPSDDGGFYLLAIKRCPDGLLANLPWSSPVTFAKTLDRLRDVGMSPVVLDSWFDIDRPEDLDRLRADLSARPDAAPATRRALGATWSAPR